MSNSVGSTAGVAIGSIVGSAAPGIGTAVGGALGGIVGGMLGGSPGAEVTRQLTSTNPPWPKWRLDMFMQWLQEHAPNTYRTGNGLWDRSSKGSASNWWDAYVRAFQGGEGWQEGQFTLDANYRPVQTDGTGKRIVQSTENPDGTYTETEMSALDAWWLKYGSAVVKWGGILLGLGLLLWLVPKWIRGGGITKTYGTFRSGASQTYRAARSAYRGARRRYGAYRQRRQYRRR